jgi:DNA-directed RNA polymerase specialized sigma24 family protein
MLQNDINKPSKPQEDISPQTFSLIRNLVGKKLNTLYIDYLEDITQTVLVKLLKWKAKRSDFEISEEDWLKIVNVAAQNAVKTFYSQKVRREIPTEDADLNDLAGKSQIIKTEGNTDVELRSLLLPLWEAFQTLPIRQKIAFILSNEHFIIELLVNKCCSIKELSDSVNLPEKDFTLLLEKIPLSDEEISRILEKNLKESISTRNVWKARNRAKLNLFQTLKGDK